MTLGHGARIIRHEWKLIVATVLVTVLAAGATWGLRPAEYTARVVLFVAEQSAEPGRASELARQRVPSYVELIDDTRVSSEVLARTDLPMTPDELADTISASAAPESVVIEVAVTAASPTIAATAADAVGDVVVELVDELERPATPDLPAPVTARVVQPATVPATPSSAGPGLTMAVGLLIGVALSLVAAVVRQRLDTRISSAQLVRTATGRPHLGTLPAVGRPWSPLSLRRDPASPRAEAFRRLRTTLRFLDPDRPPRAVLVAGADAGDGRSSTLIDLAVTLAGAGQRVLVVEADLRGPGVSDLLGVPRPTGLTTVLAGRSELGGAIRAYPDGGFDVLASGPRPPNPGDLLASPGLVELLDGLRGSHDVVLIDSPPLLTVADGLSLAAAVDGVLLVCRSGHTTRDRLTEAATALDSVSARLLGTVLTMHPARPGPGAAAQAVAPPVERTTAPPRPTTRQLEEVAGRGHR